jgi:hypothetical protein
MPSSRETEIFPHVAFALNLQKLVFIFCLTNDLEIEELKLGLKKKITFFVTKRKPGKEIEKAERKKRERRKRKIVWRRHLHLHTLPPIPQQF